MNKKLLTAAPPPHTGWVLGEFHKITKRRKDIWVNLFRQLFKQLRYRLSSSIKSIQGFKSTAPCEH